jgi:hypothetical protein
MCRKEIKRLQKQELLAVLNYVWVAVILVFLFGHNGSIFFMLVPKEMPSDLAILGLVY